MALEYFFHYSLFQLTSWLSHGHNKAKTKDTTIILLLIGWNLQTLIGALSGSLTVRTHEPLLTYHNIAVPSKEQDRIRSLDVDQQKSIK